jgi:hypothetical protein
MSTDVTAARYEGWTHMREQLEWLAAHRQEEDELGGARRARNSLHSRLLCWVAFDRAA